MTWKILITDGLDPAGVSHLSESAEVIEAGDLDGLEEMDALIVRSRTKVTAEVLKRGAPRLKVVGRAGVGVDNIDLETARRLGVKVVNAPMGAKIAVAEHALALMLALARGLPRADRGMRAGEWEKKALKGNELYGKTLGIIGTGRIGAALAERVAGLGMTVVGYDALLTPDEIHGLGIEPVELEELLRQSDYVSLHIPLNESTRGMIGRQQLQMLKPGSRIISTARGGVVDEDALLEALNSGHIAGAGLDVFSEEPPGATPLIEHPDVISTPHIAAQTVEAQERAAVDIAAEVLSALRDEKLRWQVA